MRRFTKEWARQALTIPSFSDGPGPKIRWTGVGLLMAAGAWAIYESTALRGDKQIGGLSLASSVWATAAFLAMFGRTEAVIRWPRITYIAIVGLLVFAAGCVVAIGVGADGRFATSAATAAWTTWLLAAVGFIGALTPQRSVEDEEHPSHDRDQRHGDHEEQPNSYGVANGCAFIALGLLAILRSRRCGR